MNPRAETAIPTVDGDALSALRDHRIHLTISPPSLVSKQPPLNLFGLPARYAAALYTAGSKAGNLATVQAEFKTVSHHSRTQPRVARIRARIREDGPDRGKKRIGLFTISFCFHSSPVHQLTPLPTTAAPTQVIDAANADKKFKVFLEDPTMPKAKKMKALSDFCDGAKFLPITKSFLGVVAENGRLDQNQKIYDALEEYTLAAAGQKKATVTSAQALTPEQLKDLTAKLGAHVGAGEELKVETKVDPKLVGGFTVAMGEDFFDLSLMSRIRQMEQELSKPV